MRAITVTYRLRDGSHGRTTVLARTTAEAICTAIETWGDALRMASAKPNRSSP